MNKQDFKVGDDVIYFNGDAYHLATLNSLDLTTNQAHITFHLKRLVPPEMTVPLHMLESINWKDEKPSEAPKCDCGAHHTSQPNYHIGGCPMNKRK